MCRPLMMIVQKLTMVAYSLHDGKLVGGASLLGCCSVGNDHREGVWVEC